MTGRGEGEDPFRQLVFRTYRLVLWHLQRKGVSAEDAEDLAQETYLSAYRGFPRFRGEAGVERWLLTIADNRWRNWIRHRRTEKRFGHEISLDSAASRHTLAIEAELVDDAGPARRALDSEKIGIVRSAVAELPPQMRHCATLRLFRGLSYREIAALLGISVDAVKVQLFRARKRIRSRLREYHDDLVESAR